MESANAEEARGDLVEKLLTKPKEEKLSQDLTMGQMRMKVEASLEVRSLLTSGISGQTMEAKITQALRGQALDQEQLLELFIDSIKTAEDMAAFKQCLKQVARKDPESRKWLLINDKF